MKISQVQKFVKSPLSYFTFFSKKFHDFKKDIFGEFAQK